MPATSSRPRVTAARACIPRNNANADPTNRHLEFSIPGTGGNAGKSLLTRKVEPRNTPTSINAAYTDRNFWDGRANNIFNGNDPFGLRNTGAGRARRRRAAAISRRKSWR